MFLDYFNIIILNIIFLKIKNTSYLKYIIRIKNWNGEGRVVLPLRCGVMRKQQILYPGTIAYRLYILRQIQP